MFHFAFWWYVSVDQFDLFGKLRVILIVWPGNLKVGGKVIGFSSPAGAQARVRSGLRIITTPVLIHPYRYVFHSYHNGTLCIL